MTQPAVSRYIQELEGLLKLRLFDRTTRAVVLTAAGHSLQNHTERLLDQFQSALAEVTTEHARDRSVVRIGAEPLLSNSLLVPNLPLCQHSYPSITVVLHAQSAASTLSMVREGQLDFGLLASGASGSEVHAEPILDDVLFLACPSGHPWTALAQVEWSQLATQSLVLLDRHSEAHLLWQAKLAACGAMPARIQEAISTDAAFRQVADGAGLGLLPGLAWPAPAGVAVVPVPIGEPVARRISLVRRAGRPLNPSAHLIWKLLANADLMGAIPRRATG